MPTVQTNDVETYYERRGSGPPIVFVHGAILDHGQWEPQVADLSDAFTTIAYDVRGHGRTGESARDVYVIDLFASDLEALVDELDVDRPVLCGLSTGGCIAQTYAARNPERVAGLVLADTFSPAIFDWREWLQRVAVLRAAIPLVRVVGYERVERVLVWLQERFGGEGVSGDYQQIERLRAAGPKMETAEFAKVIRAVANFHETEVDLSAITAPTLVLYGENEPAFIRRHAPRFAAAIPDTTVRAVPGAGHASNLDHPEFFTAALHAFLSGLETHAGAGVTDSGSDVTEPN